MSKHPTIPILRNNKFNFMTHSFKIFQFLTKACAVS